jgi:cytochrome c-type biogenesis protein CcmH/NrfG
MLILTHTMMLGLGVILGMYLPRVLGRVKVDRRIVQLEALLRQNPDDPETYIAIANAYAYQGRTDAAIHAYERAIKLAPDSVRPYLSLASVYATKQEYPLAIEWLEKARAVAEKHSPAVVPEIDEQMAVLKRWQATEAP